MAEGAAHRMADPSCGDLDRISELCAWSFQESENTLMVSTIQYDAFKASYDEERARTLDLRNTGKVSLGICAFLLGILSFRADRLFFAQETDTVFAGMFAVSLALLVLAFIVLLYSIGIYSNETMLNRRRLGEVVGSGPIKDEEFLDGRIIDTLVSWEKRRKANIRRVMLIRVASVAMACGTALAFTALVACSL